MTNDQRDKMIMETHAMVTTTSKEVARVIKDIDGNGQKGIKERLGTVETKQDECPARARSQRDGRMFVVTVCMALIAAGSFVWTVYITTKV